MDTRRIAIVALTAFCFIAGTAYAIALPNSSVGSKQLKRGAVGTKQLKAGAVTAAKVDTRSVGRIFQLRVFGTCSGGAAIDSMHEDGSVGCAPAGGPPSGSAGGALAGSYPNPSLNVTGAPCANGQALRSVSSGAVLDCATGVYSDGALNLAVSPQPFPGLAGGQDDTAIGAGALAGNLSGVKNVAVGRLALHANAGGDGNVAVGNSALESNLGGAFNSAFGFLALHSNTSGDDNAAVGSGALYSNTVAGGNSALGDNALALTTSGGQNVAVGQNALLANTTAGRNMASGAAALMANTVGSENTAAGHSALLNNTSGSHNVGLGFEAGRDLATGSNDIYVGAEVTGSAGESNTTRIGLPGTQTRAFLAGVSGVTTEGVAAPVVIDANGQLGTTSSSRSLKREIRPLGARLDGLMSLRPVSFRYRDPSANGGGALQFGLIAEQVAKVYPNLVVRSRDGRASAIAYQELPALLIAQAQRQERVVGRLRAQLRRQRLRIDWLMHRMRRR